MTQPGTGLQWCRWCGQESRYEGGGEPSMRKAVHSGTGRERGEDGHLAAPQDFEPVLWKAVRELRAEFGGRFAFTARLGILRADWEPPTGEHFTGGTAGELRGKLVAALAAEAASVP